MAYTHTNKAQITCANDPIDADATEWVFFSYKNWLRTNESITTHTALIQGGSIVTDSTSIGTIVDSLGVSYPHSYGVQFTVSPGAIEVKITHRITSTISGVPDLGRTNIDHTAILKVKAL